MRRGRRASRLPGRPPREIEKWAKGGIRVANIKPRPFGNSIPVRRVDYTLLHCIVPFSPRDRSGSIASFQQLRWHVRMTQIAVVSLRCSELALRARV